jgi:fatty-acyl-CoA synthase
MDWIAKWSAESPSHPALVEAERGRVTSYASLHERAARLAAVLRQRCAVDPGDRVAALIRDRRELVELCFACRRSGAIFVPIDPGLSEPRIAELLRDCQPSVVVHETAWTEVAAALGDGSDAPMRIAIGPVNGGGALPYSLALAHAGETETVRVQLDDVAMILYPGGEAGEPRGVMLPWRQVEFNADTTAERFALSDNDRGLTAVPLCDSVGLNGLALPLLRSGGTIVLLRDYEDTQALWVLGSQGITAMVAGPAAYRRLVSAGLHQLHLERLRCLLVVGEPCPADLIEAYQELGLRLRVGYGLTEVGPSCFTFGPEDRPESVGKPVPGSSARLVGVDGSEVAVGEVGELWLQGPHMSIGYWNQPRRFERALGAGGWFRTGERARRDEEGWYYVVGRETESYRNEAACEACARS